jgi:hypothetical protein
MSVSILVVDDETDVAALFRQHFRREVRQGQYALHFASSGEEAFANGIEPQLIVILSDINMPGMDGSGAAARDQAPAARAAGDDGDRVRRRGAPPPRGRIRRRRIPHQAGRLSVPEAAAPAASVRNMMTLIRAARPSLSLTATTPTLKDHARAAGDP